MVFYLLFNVSLAQAWGFSAAECRPSQAFEVPLYSLSGAQAASSCRDLPPATKAQSPGWGQGSHSPLSTDPPFQLTVHSWCPADPNICIKCAQHWDGGSQGNANLARNGCRYATTFTSTGILLCLYLGPLQRWRAKDVPEQECRKGGQGNGPTWRGMEATMGRMSWDSNFLEHALLSYCT